MSSSGALTETGHSGFMQLTLSMADFLKHVQDEALRAVTNILHNKEAPKAFK